MQRIYHPKAGEREARFKAYDNLEKMRQLKDKKFPHFSGPEGERSFMEYIDDSERIINGYTMSRESQGKDSWQSNMLDNITRAKLRAIASGTALKVPEMNFSAIHKNGIASKIHANIFKCITRHTFQDGNPSMHNFLETWQVLSHGVLFEYEGYKTGGCKRKRVKSFDSVTGDVDFTTEYVRAKPHPFSAIISPQEFLWWDFFVRDIQDQPRIAWEQIYSKMDFETEFTKYPNYEFVHTKRQLSTLTMLRETLYYTKWSSRVDDPDGILVSKIYDKEDDAYEIWANGVPLLRAPLIWEDSKGKYYPFAKTIAEPFANTNFFVGLSLAGILEHYQDTKNTIINTMIDKLYRSMDVPMLIGLQNKDLLDVEDEFVTHDNRYYVPDINAVKPMPVNSINQGELAMLQIIDRGLESLSVDRAQQGQQTNGDRTAKEIAVADRNAQQLKTMLFLFLEDLWLQKTRLRTKNIRTHFLKDKAAQKEIREQIISVADYTFPNGEKGTLDIHLAKSNAGLLPTDDLDAREMTARNQGQVYKIISMLHDEFDDYDTGYQIVPESFHSQDASRREQEFDSEVQWVSGVYPEFMLANRDKYLEEKLSFRGKSLQDYNPPMPPPPPAAPGAAAPGSKPAPQESVLGLQ